MKNHEKELPSGYTEVFHIDALSKKMGLILNVVAMAILAVVLALAVGLPLALGKISFGAYDPIASIISSLALFAAIAIYMILHELVHGIAYKALTREKLSFGLSWSCAWCGVPDVYVYRRASLIALLAPFITFTIVLIPIAALMYFVNVYAYIVAVLVFGLHFGGCSGDLYMTILLLFKFKSQKLLVRDTGPEQSLYLPCDGEVCTPTNEEVLESKESEETPE